MSETQNVEGVHGQVGKSISKLLSGEVHKAVKRVQIFLMPSKSRGCYFPKPLPSLICTASLSVLYGVKKKWVFLVSCSTVKEAKHPLICSHYPMGEIIARDLSWH